MPRACSTLLVTLCLVACREGTPAKGEPAAAPAHPARVQETLVATTRMGTIWLVTGRTGAHVGGATCDERLIEIRRDSSRIRVPLLYTGSVPRLVNDSTIEAALWLHCTAGDTYRVNLRTGQPVKHRVAGGSP